jgi:hypothetical protein
LNENITILFIQVLNNFNKHAKYYHAEYIGQRNEISYHRINIFQHSGHFLQDSNCLIMQSISVAALSFSILRIENMSTSGSGGRESI